MIKGFFVIINKSDYEKNTIKFNNLYGEKDLKKLDSVTKIKKKKLDSISYLIKPTRRELDKILMNVKKSQITWKKYKIRLKIEKSIVFINA